MTDEQQVEFSGDGALETLDPESMARMTAIGRTFKMTSVLHGLEFRREFEVVSVIRGAVAALDHPVIPAIAHRCHPEGKFSLRPPWCGFEFVARRDGVLRNCPGEWKIGFYEDPEIDDRGPLLAELELRRVA